MGKNLSFKKLLNIIIFNIFFQTLNQIQRKEGKKLAWSGKVEENSARIGEMFARAN